MSRVTILVLGASVGFALPRPALAQTVPVLEVAEELRLPSGHPQAERSADLSPSAVCAQVEVTVVAPARCPLLVAPPPSPVVVEPETRIRPGLTFTGLGMLLGSYAGSLMFTVPYSEAYHSAAFVPVVGPMICLADGGCDQRDHFVTTDPLMVLSAIGQVVGLTMFIAGLTWRRPVDGWSGSGDPTTIRF